MTETVWGWVVSSAWHGGRKGPSKSCVKINTELAVQVLVGVGWSLLSPETSTVAPVSLALDLSISCPSSSFLLLN